MNAVDQSHHIIPDSLISFGVNVDAVAVEGSVDLLEEKLKMNYITEIIYCFNIELTYH